MMKLRDALKAYAKDVRDTMRHVPPNPELAVDDLRIGKSFATTLMTMPPTGELP